MSVAHLSHCKEYLNRAMLTLGNDSLISDYVLYSQFACIVKNAESTIAESSRIEICSECYISNIEIIMLYGIVKNTKLLIYTMPQLQNGDDIMRVAHLQQT